MFPHLAGLRIVNVLTTGATVHIHAETTSAAARCPHCSASSRRVHSRYQRQLLDATLGGRQSVLHLRVRRFFCTEAVCARRIFAEQIHGLTTRYGRISAMARAMLEPVGLALGGRAGARLGERVGLAVRRMSLLRLIRALPIPTITPVSALGWTVGTVGMPDCGQRPDGWSLYG